MICSGRPNLAIAAPAARSGGKPAAVCAATDELLPRYRELVDAARGEAATADRASLARIVDRLGREAGVALWYLAVVGGSAWKMEACLVRFARRHLPQALPSEQGGAQIMLAGLIATPGQDPRRRWDDDWHGREVADSARASSA
jgi:pyruvate,water dikinase